MEKIIIEIEKDGTIKGFADEVPNFISVKEIERKRVSRIVPKNLPLRIAFVIIRSLVSDNSKIANWTRNWKCNWIVVIGKKQYGPFKNRTKAIEFEKEIIRKTWR
ncbi:hypothetical protein [Persephonella sp. KM09-Lau-8]|uniref:hypothetical protein n=1 Tax=Persephonella sp. KM09-Lau-8 TaxID=1158345 RepID=UPI0004983761|nr:hypothetical protein [Persephonella sp. KM09-Lau-8]